MISQHIKEHLILGVPLRFDGGEDYLPLSGGNLTGPLSSNSTAQFTALTSASVSAATYLGLPANPSSVTMVILSANTDATTTTYVNAGQSATLAAGTYEYEVHLAGLTASTTSGVQGAVTISGNNDTMHAGTLFKASNISVNGGSIASNCTIRSGSATLQHAVSINSDAPNKACTCYTRGIFTLSTATTFYISVSNRVNTAATAMVNGVSYRIVSAGTTVFTDFGAANNNVGTIFTKSGGAGTGTGTVNDMTNPSSVVAGSFMKFTKY
jgi:hypothetical protein